MNIDLTYTFLSCIRNTKKRERQKHVIFRNSANQTFLKQKNASKNFNRTKLRQLLWPGRFSEMDQFSSGSFLAEISPKPGPGFEWGTVTKRCDHTFSSQNVTFQVRCDAARFRKSLLSTSKNVTIFLELGTNVTISSHRHIAFLGSAWNTPEFENLARSWVLCSRFSNFGLEPPSVQSSVHFSFIFKSDWGPDP